VMLLAMQRVMYSKADHLDAARAPPVGLTMFLLSCKDYNLEYSHDIDW
jgi:hypothetical protein